MPAPHPAASLSNVLSLPARQFAVVDAGHLRARILHASVHRGQPRLIRTEVIDAHDEGFTTPEELQGEVRRRLAEAHPEAVVLVVPQHQVLRHILDAPAGDPAQTRAYLEREAVQIAGLSDSPWVFDAVRARPGFLSTPAATSNPPLIADFCRQDDLQKLIDSSVEDPQALFDIRSAGDALAAAFAATQSPPDAILIDLGARHTTVDVVVRRQVIATASFASGSAAFTEAIAADLGSSRESAEVLKRSEPPVPSPNVHPRYAAALQAWAGELEQVLSESTESEPGLSARQAGLPVFLAGGGSLQPRLPSDLSGLGPRAFELWPAPLDSGPDSPELAVAWGALRLALNLADPAPSLLPAANRSFWSRQRFWRGLLSANLTLAAMLLVALTVAAVHQTRILRAKVAWQSEAATALYQAREVRAVAEDLNSRMDAFRPVLERQRHTVETLELLATLQLQRTNAACWYLLLADAQSYAAGSNDFAAALSSFSAPGPRPADSRPSIGASTNGASASRAFVAEVCFVPEGEAMRQALSDLVMDLKRFPLFRNVDVLPAESRRERVATNLYFPERLFALELNLSEAELLPPLPLPRLGSTNREPRVTFRTSLRPEALASTNHSRTPRPR